MSRTKWAFAALALALCQSLFVAGGCASTGNAGNDDGATVPPAVVAATGVVKRAVCVGMLSSRFAGQCPGADVDVQVAAMAPSTNWTVTVLRDQSCTRASALAALDADIDGAGPGSELFLFWSGHGGQTDDLNGDEIDGRDEHLCPWDAPLLDDDLATRLDRLPAGAFVFAIFDTCNSGTMARRGLSKPVIVNPRTFKASAMVLAGCADGKSSFGNVQGGLLTTAWVDARTNGISYGAWCAATVKKMLAANEGLPADEQQVPVVTEYGDCSAWRDRAALK